jgi:hypothetical protein
MKSLLLVSVPAGYIDLVKQVRDTQKQYLDACVLAKQTPSPGNISERIRIFHHKLSVEHRLDEYTDAHLRNIYGSMTAEQAIEQLKLNLEDKPKS